MKTFFLCALMVGLGQSVAQAQYRTGTDSTFILDPYVGYEMGYLTQKGIPEITTQGVNFGARIGFNLGFVDAGVDFMMGSMTTKQSSQSGDYKPTDYGLFFGHTFGSGFSLRASYFLSSKAKVQSDANPQDFAGSGYKLGLGWRVLSYCDLSVELINRNYTKYDQTSLTNSLLGSSAGISIAIPIL